MRKIIKVIAIVSAMFVGMVLADTHVNAPKETTTPVSDEVNTQFDQAMKAQDDYIADVLNK